ncbi:MAG: hypothetical protein D6743_01085 [Calditrichaeota bacterium]|nr:MAG: hypothetical protein D6743_01085 [Calditrichota bacterium]
MKSFLMRVVLPTVSVLLVACGTAPSNTATSNNTTTTTSTTTPSAPPANLTLIASQYQVKSDNSDSATITAIVTDANNAAVSGQTVTFTASGGFLSANSAVTDAYGQASVTFSAGAIDKSNRTVTITASVGAGLQAQVPIVVTGTTVNLTASKTNLPSDGSVGDALVVRVLDAGGNPIYNVPVTVTVSGTGNVRATPRAGATDTAGQVIVDVYGAAAGTATVTVAAAGATASVNYTVSAPANAFGITAPGADPYTMTTNTPLTVTVNAPGLTSVIFSTSLGKWQSSGGATAQVAVAGSTASAVLQSSNAGVATVQVQDANNPAVSDTLTVIFAQPASAAKKISAQANVNVVPPSTGGQQHTATITATVTDASNQPVAGAPVVFSIANPSGGGESVSPVYVLTDAFGRAQTTFTSGSLATGGQGVDIYATLANVQNATPGQSPYSVVNIVVGGQAGSVVLGHATVATELNPATYSLPMSVLVTDGNGNAVPGATVTLKTWPAYFHFGYGCGIYFGVGDVYSQQDPFKKPSWKDPYTVAIPNEDANQNNVLDPYEDMVYDVYSGTRDPYTGVFTATGHLGRYYDGGLTPPSSAAGSVPPTVVTDANGVATFDLVYLKQYALWIDTKITATTQVLGTETRTEVTFTLPALEKDLNPCRLPPSPFNDPAWGF